MGINLQGEYERSNISPTTRTLLCVFAAGDFERPIPRVEADWKQVLAGVCQNGLIGLTYHYLNQRGTLDYPPPAFRQQIQTAYRMLVIRMEMLYHQIGQVLTQLAQAGIDSIVVKGPALAHQVYSDPMFRSFNDLDLIVREDSWGRVHCFLIENGYVSEQEGAQPPPKLVPQSSIYETKYWNRTTKFLVEVHYEDIFNAGLRAHDVDGFWKRAVMLKLGKNGIKVPALEDQLIHACAHLHAHGYTRLNWFSDLACIVRDHANQLDWDRVINTVQTEELQVSVYYSLYFLERLLNVSTPRTVLVALRPDRFRRWWHEYYLPTDQVLSFRRMFRPVFSFHFTPLLERLLPDLLVMGRRKEKFHYLWRLLLPPRDWLCYYYHLTDPRSVSFHYILHPVKLAYHYLAEIVTFPFTQRRKNEWLQSPPND